MDRPQTLQQAIVYFSDKTIAHQYLVDLRWSDGVVCPKCGGLEYSYHRIADWIAKLKNAHLFWDLKEMPEMERQVNIVDLERLFEEMSH